MANEKEPKNKWEDIYGETEVEFGPEGRVKITERKSGEVTERIEKAEESAYDKLNEFEKRRVNAELGKFEEESRKYMSAAQLTQAYDQKREELSKKTLELRKENLGG
jgi:hypothetical protein